MAAVDHATAIDELRAALGDKVSVNAAIREHHSKDESFHAPVVPDAVVFAASTDDVATALRICNRHRTPVVAFGAGTSLEANSTPIFGGVSLDLSRMDKVLRVSRDDLDCTVQAGVRRKQLNELLARDGLFFPVDPGADATLGGMASTGASGTTTVKYGAMKQLVLGLTVVMASGEVVTTARRARKTSAGYDLTHVFVGAEGTLGVITELNLRVFGIPETIAAATVQFPAVRNAVDAVIEIVQLGISVARSELVCDKAVAAVNKYSGLSLPEQPMLLLEFHGTPASVALEVEAVRTITESHGGFGYRETADEGERRKLWQARHDASTACRIGRKGSGRYATDVCVPISRLSECIEETLRDLDASGIYGPIVGHVGDGNFHVLLAVDHDDDDEVRRIDAFHSRLVRRAIEMEGSCTGEHGIGVGKMEFLAQELGDAAVSVMAQMKRALDPHNIMNPGKVIDERYY